MKKFLIIAMVLCMGLAVSACVHRISMLSPHRTNTDFHRQAKANQTCLECHQIAEIGKGHQATDDCLKCHRIVQGD